MKRGNDNSQLRPEEVEALEEEDGEEAGTFRKASSAVLAERKIVRSKSKPTPGATPLAAPAVGVFGSINLQTPANKEVVNPFGGGFQLNKTVPAVVNPFGSITPQQPQSLSSSFSTSTVPVKETSSKSGVSEYNQKIAKLNASFCNWIELQLKENPLCIWKEGMQGYIDYCEQLQQKYNIKESEIAQSTGTSFSAADTKKATVPAATAAAPTAVAPVVVAAAPVANNPFSAPGFGFSASNNNNSNKPAEIVPKFAFGAPPSTAPAPAAPAPVAPAAPLFGGFGTTSFGSTPAASTSAAPANGAKNGNPPVTNPVSTGFNFSLPAFGGFTAPAATSTGASNNMFALPSGSMFGAAASTSSSGVSGGLGGGAGGEQEDDGEDEGEPILEPSKILKNAEDTDVVEFEAPCKLYRFSMEDKEWKDVGKGVLRVSHAPDSKKRRIVIRNMMGKISMNSYFHKTMTFDVKKNAISFSAVTGSSTMDKFNVKVKESDVQATLKALEAGRSHCE